MRYGIKHPTKGLNFHGYRTDNCNSRLDAERYARQLLLYLHADGHDVTSLIIVELREHAISEVSIDARVSVRGL